MKRLIYTCIVLLLLSGGAFAQKVLSLEKSIDIAINNNLSIRTARNTALAAKSGYTQSKLAFLPSLNMSSGLRWSEGNQLNTAQERVAVNSWSANSGLSTGATIFNGFAQINTLAQSKYRLEAALDQIDNTILTTKVNVVIAYLFVIQGRETLKIFQQRLDVLKQQLSRAEKFQAAGRGDLESVNNFKSQAATVQLNYVNQENQLKSSELSLLQLLLLDPSEDYDFEAVTISDALLTSELPEYNEVLQKSMDFSPSLKAANNNFRASEKGLKISRASRLPSLGVGASYGTGWTSRIDEAFIDQYDLNISKGMSFNLNVPIFRNGSINNQIQQAKVGMLNSELNLQQSKNTITNIIQRAYLDLLNAQTSYSAALENSVAFETSLKFSQTRYENGTIDFVTYLQSLNNKNGGDFQLTNAKYAFLLRDYVLKLYTGEMLDSSGSN